MINSAAFMAFLAASMAIILAPGPAQALTLARSISDGRKAGILTAVGLNVGTIVHAFAAALGLSAVLATSAIAFAAVKYVGAAYLGYLGIKALLTKEHATNSTEPSAAKEQQVFPKAVVTGLLNPKVALFFLAFLPQFVDARRGPVFLQFVVLGITLAVLDIVYECVIVTVAGLLMRWFTENPNVVIWRQRIMGSVLIGLGVRLALAHRE